jgi:hypothetical protein
MSMPLRSFSAARGCCGAGESLRQTGVANCNGARAMQVAAIRQNASVEAHPHTDLE